jgi:hypothetical protein
MRKSTFLVVASLLFISTEAIEKIDGGSLLEVNGLDCTYPDIYGNQQCIAGITSAILDVTASDSQHASQWCWAASIQGVFSYYGHEVPQERIVEETWGAIVNMPGQPGQILSALNRQWIDENGDVFQVSATTLTANHVTAAQDLAADNPLIIGTMGHAMILTAVEYTRNARGQGNIINAIVRDPWPYNPRRRSLTPQEWYNTTFLARIRVD